MRLHQAVKLKVRFLQVCDKLFCVSTNLPILTIDKSLFSGKECLACTYYNTPRRELFKELTDYPMIVTAFYIKEDTPLLEMALDR